MDDMIPSPQTTLGILLGASDWPHTNLSGSPAFARSAHKVRGYFLYSDYFGVSPENWLDLFDTHLSSPDEIDQVIGNFLQERILRMKQAGTPARDMLFYYIGHGLFAPGYDKAYHLAIRSTRENSLRSSAIPLVALAETLKTNARQLRRIVILDCCFAAESLKYMQSAPDQAALQQTVTAFEEKSIGSGFPGKGTALLCSSGNQVPSLILPDESGTMFSEAFIRALVQGSSHQREKTHLSLYDLRTVLEDTLEVIAKGNAPRPVLHSPDQREGDVASIPFFPNLQAEEGQMRKAEEERAYALLKAQARQAAKEKLAREAEEVSSPQQTVSQPTKTALSAEEWMKRGNTFFDRKEYDSALKAYEQVIQIDAEESEAYAKKSRTLNELKQYKEAIIAAKQAIFLNPDSLDAYYSRGLAYNELKEYQKAIDDLGQVIRIDPNFAKAYYERGRAYYDLDEYQKAIADFDQAIRIDPNFAKAYYSRGLAYNELKEYQKAIDDFDQAIRFDPNSASAYLGRGRAFYGLKEYQKATADFDQAIRIDPNRVNAYSGQAITYLELKEYREAIANFDQAIRIDPNSASAYLGRGRAFYGLKEYQEYEKAIDDFDQVIRLDPNSASAYYERGRAFCTLHYNHLNEIGNAIYYFDQAIRLDPKFAKAYYERGRAFQAIRGVHGEKKAIADFDQVIRLDPFASAYLGRGRAFYGLKEYQKAIDDFDQVIRLDPNSASAYYEPYFNRSNAYYERGSAYYYLEEYQKAIADFDQVIRINPKYAIAYFYRGNAYYNLKEYEKAIDDYDQSIRLVVSLLTEDGRIREKVGFEKGELALWKRCK
jgi:tetratricopeptide (TPR) repeat protein